MLSVVAWPQGRKFLMTPRDESFLHYAEIFKFNFFFFLLIHRKLLSTLCVYLELH